MTDLPKSWYTSKGVWAGILTSFLPVALLFHHFFPTVPLPTLDDVSGMLATIGTLAAAAVAVYGRVVAKAPIAKPSTPKIPTIPATTTTVLLLAAVTFFVGGCAGIEADAAIIAQKVSQNATAIQAFCASDVLPAANSPITKAALLVADALPYGSNLTLATNSAVATCNNIASVATSLTTLPWLESQIPVIKGAGKIAPPPAVAPAPVTATSSVPSV